MDIVSDEDSGPMREAPLEAGQHGVGSDGAKFVGESPVKYKDDYSEDPLTDGCCVL